MRVNHQQSVLHWWSDKIDLGASGITPCHENYPKASLIRKFILIIFLLSLIVYPCPRSHTSNTKYLNWLEQAKLSQVQLGFKLISIWPNFGQSKLNLSFDLVNLEGSPSQLSFWQPQFGNSFGLFLNILSLRNSLHIR